MNNLNIKQYLNVSVLSLVTALFAYLLVFFVGNFASLYFAYDFDIGASFSISGLIFELERSHPSWTYDAEVTIFLSRPLLSLVIGILSLIVLILIKKVNLIFFLFLFWLNIFSFNAAFGLFVDDFISQAGLFFVAERMELGIGAMIFSLGVTVFIMYRLGVVNSLIFMQILPQKANPQSDVRLLIVLITVFIPWLLTGIILILLSYPGHSLSEHLDTISTVIILFPFLFTKKKKLPPKFGKLINIKINEWFIAFVMILLSILLYITMLSPVVIGV